MPRSSAHPLSGFRGVRLGAAGRGRRGSQPSSPPARIESWARLADRLLGRDRVTCSSCGVTRPGCGCDRGAPSGNHSRRSVARARRSGSGRLPLRGRRRRTTGNRPMTGRGSACSWRWHSPSASVTAGRLEVVVAGQTRRPRSSLPRAGAVIPETASGSSPRALQ